MGNCSSKPDLQRPDTDIDVTENDWESLSLDREAEDGTTASTGSRSSTSSTGQTGENDIVSSRQSITEQYNETMETQNDSTNRKVRFHIETPEKNVLREIFSEESLLEKRRKSFSADMRIFAVMFEESKITNKEGKT
ncbi:uncharacterized protein LOC123548599 [Mercenaria mercenaria]|uniref:uncharacterized protein LOC123548599 n=1 Tax=Mercenaria mercenaria TaxID=6596 RepID=UPI00234EFD21|nr:uncharacterized protein LOC123548599 [Mercenaria mercenaria]